MPSLGFLYIIMARSTRGKKKINAVGLATVQKPKLPEESDKNKDFQGKWVPFFKHDSNTFPNDMAKGQSVAVRTMHLYRLK